jgi:hypothetical protein
VRWKITLAARTLFENAKAIHLWTAVSGNRDFRQAKWLSRTLKIQPGSSHAAAEVKAPQVGYLAYLNGSGTYLTDRTSLQAFNRGASDARQYTMTVFSGSDDKGAYIAAGSGAYTNQF